MNRLERRTSLLPSLAGLTLLGPVPLGLVLLGPVVLGLVVLGLLLLMPGLGLPVLGPPVPVPAMAPAAAAGGVRGAAARVQEDGDRAWPVAGGPPPEVVRGWDPPASPWGAGHRGADLRAAPGQPVRAAAPGRVSYAGSVAGRGVVAVELADPAGVGPPLRTTYEPVRARVREGQRVRAGEVVGTLQSGPFHCAGGCVHWGLLRGDRYLDPLSLLPAWMRRSGHARLLPVFGVPRAGGAGVSLAAAAAPAGSGRPGGPEGPGGSGRTVREGLAAGWGALLLTAGALWGHGRHRAGHGRRHGALSAPQPAAPRAGPSPPPPR